MELSKSNGKEYVPEEPESDPSLSDLSWSESDFSNDRKYIRYTIKRRNKNKKRQKRMKQDASDSSSGESDFSKTIGYRSKKLNKKNSHREKDPIKLCAK